MPLLTYEEVAKHNKPGDAWVIVEGSVYDVSAFAPSHPGGAKYIYKYAGKVATEEFLKNHPVTIIRQTLPNGGADNLMGTVDLGVLPAAAMEPNAGFDEKPKAAVNSEADPVDEIPPLPACLNANDFEAVARKFMPLLDKKGGMDYYISGGDDERTLRENANVYQRIWLKPRILRNVANVDMSCTLLGTPCSIPLYLSSVAMQRLGHEDGELAWVRAAKQHQVVHMLPTMSSVSAEELMGECQQLDHPFWYQLYVHPDRQIAKEMVQAAEARGCTVLFITCDTPTLGRRDRDRRNKIDTSASGSGSAGGSGAIGAGSPKDASLNWDDIPWFRSITSMKLVLKGVQTAADAVLAVNAGVDGIVCSNHGGRQQDTARSGLEVLSEDRFTVLCDGGVRRGSDIVKALALGATAVGIGKPVSFAMSVYGQPGIESLLQIYKDEFKNTMQLMGVTSIDQIRKEGLELVDASNLSTHIEPSPNDYMRLPTVNVLTHGLPEAHALALPSATSEMPITTTTTTTETKPDGTIVTTSVSTTGPPGTVPAVQPDVSSFELHGYQLDFLEQSSQAQQLAGGAAAAFERLVGFALKEPAIKAEIYDKTFHCVHCDSKKPPDWIQNNKGEKIGYPLALSEEAVEFLGQEMLLEVGPPGPDKAVIEGGALRADADKAARCCIDWAIKTFGGLEGGLCWFQLHGYQHEFLGDMAKIQGLADEAAALQKIVNLAMTDPAVKAAIFDDGFHCVHCNSLEPPPPDWINAAKGQYNVYGLPITPIACAFLQMELLLNVEKVGEPPVKMVVPGPLQSDMNKAARCCIDWAIKEYRSRGAALGFDNYVAMVTASKL